MFCRRQSWPSTPNNVCPVSRPLSHPSPRATGYSLRHPLALLGYLLLTVGMTWPLAAQLTSAIPGDSFDGWQNYWNLWWVKIALVERQQTPFVTDLLYAPTGVGLYFHTLNPFNGLLTLPIQLSGSLLLAYNAVVFFSWVMGGYGVYLLTLWLLPRQAVTAQAPTQQTASAFVAGAIFTFAPFHMAHLLGHMQVMSLEWIPFYILYLLKAIAQCRQGRPWLRHALMAGLFLTLTGLCDWYFVLYLFFFTALVMLWQLVAGLGQQASVRGRAIKAAFLPAAIAGLSMLLLLSPVLIPMVR